MDGFSRGISITRGISRKPSGATGISPFDYADVHILDGISGLGASENNPSPPMGLT
jgi:hypothetical protein